jgi:hypothetical protein
MSGPQHNTAGAIYCHKRRQGSRLLPGWLLELAAPNPSGIHACWLIYQEYAESPGSADEQGGAEDEASYDAEHEALMAAFIEAVRAEAAQRRERLL